jgi:hypothetical protein
MSLTKPRCRYGYPVSQLRDELDAGTFSALNEWMTGQTFMLCNGTRYNHDTESYEPTECACGPVYYRWDVDRFFAGSPVVD